jgi:uncharacterized protein
MSETHPQTAAERIPIRRIHLEPQTGASLLLEQGQSLRVIDVQGAQVSDLIAFNAADTREWLSSGRSLDYASTIYLTTGHTLYSNRSTPMLTITSDTVGRHDFLYTPCSPETFKIIYKQEDGDKHPSCFMNLANALREHNIQPDSIPTTFNIFMNADVLPSGELDLKPPRSRAGDYIEFRAEMNLVIGLTACSAEMSNGGTFKPIDAEIYPAQT